MEQEKGKAGETRKVAETMLDRMGLLARPPIQLRSVGLYRMDCTSGREVVVTDDDQNLLKQVL